MANDKYLSKEGLSYFWTKLKSSLTSIGNRLMTIEGKESGWDAKADVEDIPTTTNDLTNNSGFITKAVDDLTNYTLTSNLSTVATSGDYNDLSNEPLINQGQVNNINFNSLATGRYICSYTGSATGNPSSGAEGLCITMINDSPTYGAQMCQSNGGFYFREYNGGVWGSWERTESTSNKVTGVSASSTDTQYPSAKALYDIKHNIDFSLGNCEVTSKKMPIITENLGSDTYPSVPAVIDFVNDKVSGKESTSNKVTSISSSSTNTQYPSAKAVYDTLKFVPYSGQNASWQNATAGGAQWFFYEGASTSTYSLPTSNCLIIVFKQSSARGYALAFSWPNGTNSVWHNNLHDSWRGWQSWH